MFNTLALVEQEMNFDTVKPCLSEHPYNGLSRISGLFVVPQYSFWAKESNREVNTFALIDYQCIQESSLNSGLTAFRFRGHVI